MLDLVATYDLITMVLAVLGAVFIGQKVYNFGQKNGGK